MLNHWDMESHIPVTLWKGNTMQKKLLTATACMIAILVIIGIAVTNRTSEDSQQVEQILQDDSEEETALVSLEEVRKEADAVIEAGRNGEYRNLKFNEIQPLITEEDQIYSIKVTDPNVPATEENLDKALDMMQILLEESIDERLITVTMPLDSGLDRITVEELREWIQSQDEKYTGDGYWLLYLNDEQCAQTNSYMSSLWIDRGIEGTTLSGENELDQVYYAGAMDGSLQDVYETASGEMSVEEAIEQVEKYFNHEFPISLSGEIEYRVARVYILKMPDGTYAFDCAMRRSYGGVLFENANSGVMLQEGDEEYDMMEAVLDRKNHALFFNGVACNMNVEKIQEISKVIPLERAAEYISQKIGDNTVYTVKEIELAYMGKYVEPEDGRSYETLTPKWIFFMTNETSGRDIRFYVDVVTGEVETREIND